MIRIVGKRKPADKPENTAKSDKTILLVLKLIGIIVSDHPAAIQKLLENHGLKLSVNPTETELIQGMFRGIARKDEKFNTELAAVMLLSLLQKARNLKAEKEEDHFNYAEAISGALNTAGNVFGQHLKNKGDKDQLTGQTIQQMQAYKHNRQMASNSNNKWIVPAAIVAGGLILTGIGYLIYNNSRTQTAQVLANVTNSN